MPLDSYVFFAIATHHSSALIEAVEHPNHKRLPTKRPSSIDTFTKNVRLARGNRCENCGASEQAKSIQGHHVLDYHTHPELGTDEENIVVLCDVCHTGLSRPKGDFLGEKALCYSRFRPELRHRIAAYVERKAPELTTFIYILRSGENAALNYFFRRLR